MALPIIPAAGEGSASHEVSPRAMLIGMGLIIARSAQYAQQGCIRSWSRTQDPNIASDALHPNTAPNRTPPVAACLLSAPRQPPLLPLLPLLPPLPTCSQCVQAAQITFEDFFMADLAIPPLKIVGYEGVLGAATMLLLVLPVVQRLPGRDGQGLHEDSMDTWHVRGRDWGWGECELCMLCWMQGRNACQLVRA